MLYQVAHLHVLQQGQAVASDHHDVQPEQGRVAKGPHGRKRTRGSIAWLVGR